MEEECLIHGQCPGEILGCTFAAETLGGCGTAEACTTCGAVLAILTSLDGKREKRECCLVRQVESRNEVLNLMVFATPFEFQQERYTVFAINDDDLPSNSRSSTTDHRRNRGAEDPDRRECRELEVRRTEVSSRMLIEEVAENYRRHDVARDRSIAIDEVADNVIFTSDHTLLGRVLGNMVKNALEAAKPAETVWIGCRRLQDGVEFQVRNTAVMPQEAQLQVFRRAFSTKGRDRGLGTYSMKLLSEYLQGKVSFSSSETEGTVFRARYPLQ